MSYDSLPVRNMRPAAGLNSMTAIGSLLWALLNMQLRFIKILCDIYKSKLLLLFLCATARHRTVKRFSSQFTRAVKFCCSNTSRHENLMKFFYCMQSLSYRALRLFTVYCKATEQETGTSYYDSLWSIKNAAVLFTKDARIELQISR